MQSQNNNRYAPGVELTLLEKELLNIHRQYIELDDAILHGQGSARIMEAARRLHQFLLLYSTHAEQLQSKTSSSVREDPRNGWKKNLADLLQVEVGLRQEEVYAALRLRGFCKRWMHEHMSMEREGFEIAALVGARASARISA